jgi:NADH-quinone oxidoreductase subunit A
MPFDISYYKVGLVFLLFDIELLFLIPWGILLFNTNFHNYNNQIGFIFLMLLGLGFLVDYSFATFERD